jgi:pyridoxal 5-phosphate dependent beta-lyase
MNASPDWSSYTRRRPPARIVHLDSAAAGRQSRATLEATAAHAQLEAETGAYVAQEQAQDVLDRLRRDVAALFGVPAGGVAFVESATEALTRLLDAWRPPIDRPVAIVAAEWGPNIDLLTHRGHRVVQVDTDEVGRIDLDALQRTLDVDPPAFVHLTQVTSHRALVQPVSEAAAVCRAAGVPLWVDAAQAVGHVATDCGADVAYATGRKWLAGPRGAGFLAVAEAHWDRLDPARDPLVPAGLPPARYLESSEAHVAGRVGLANAVREFLDDGPAAVHARLDEVGRLAREVLSDVPGWAVVDVAGAPGAISALRPVAGQDVPRTRRRLLTDHAVLTTAALPARAPRDIGEPLLRVSPHVDCTPADLERLAAALATVG